MGKGFPRWMLGGLLNVDWLRNVPAHKTPGGLRARQRRGPRPHHRQAPAGFSAAGVFLSYLSHEHHVPDHLCAGHLRHRLAIQEEGGGVFFIVMSIAGGALMPKFMGHLGDVYNMCFSFWMPLVCFI